MCAASSRLWCNRTDFTVMRSTHTLMGQIMMELLLFYNEWNVTNAKQIALSSTFWANIKRALQTAFIYMCKSHLYQNGITFQNWNKITHKFVWIYTQTGPNLLRRDKTYWIVEMVITIILMNGAGATSAHCSLLISKICHLASH